MPGASASPPNPAEVQRNEMSKTRSLYTRRGGGKNPKSKTKLLQQVAA